MQHSMKNHPLSKEKMEGLLARAETGNLATLNPDGTPYVVPVHFVYYEDKVYIHGLPMGQKIDNLTRHPKVGFSVFDMQGLQMPEGIAPCKTGTSFESVIIVGAAAMVTDFVRAKAILSQVVKKYTPHLNAGDMPDAAIKATAIIEVTVKEITGKYR